MKTATIHSVNEIESENEIQKCNIKLSSKVYQIFTDGIYKNKIQSIIRELLANALDSHREAGTTIDPEIHLPKISEEYFYIRDFGTGLDEQGVARALTLFDSSKEDSNNYVGMFGIGIFSPCSYNTKSFTIDSYYNGTRTVYSCFIADDGCPSYIKMFNEQTTEPNGLKVQFAVNKHDIAAFSDEYDYVKSWHRTDFEKELDLFEVHDGNNAVALMGNIAYPIELAHDSLKEYSKVISSDIIFRFKIGEIDVNASREGLSYTLKTVGAIRKKIQDLLQKIDDKIKLELSNCKNDFEKAIFLSKNKILSNKYSFIGLIPAYNSIKFNHTLPFELKVSSTWRKSLHSYKTINIAYTTNYVVDDLKIGGIARAIELTKSSNQATYLIPQDNLDELMKIIGASKDNFIYASSLPKPVKIKGKYITDLMLFQKGTIPSCSWRKKVDNPTTGYYTTRVRYNALNTKEYTPREFSALLDMFNITEPIYGIPKNETINLKSVWDKIAELSDKSVKRVKDNLTLIEKYYSLNHDFRLDVGYHSQTFKVGGTNIQEIEDFLKEIKQTKEAFHKLNIQKDIDIYESIHGKIKREVSDKFSQLRKKYSVTIEQIIKVVYKNENLF